MATALLYTAGKMVLGWYLARQSTTSAYGAAGAFVVVLLYIYYSSIILFFGAEFTQVHARSRGTRILPSGHAEFVTKDERENQGMPKNSESKGKRPAPHRAPAPALGSAAFASHTGKQIPFAAVSPMEQVHGRPYSFIGLAVAAGVAAGLLWRVRLLRNGLKFYLAAKRLL